MGVVYTYIVIEISGLLKGDQGANSPGHQVGVVAKSPLVCPHHSWEGFLKHRRRAALLRARELLGKLWRFSASRGLPWPYMVQHVASLALRWTSGG